MTNQTEDLDETVRKAVASGDLRGLTEDARVAYYNAVCESVGLNPLTRPLEYLELNGRLTLYAKRDATDQLRHRHRVSIEILDRTIQEDVFIVRARATMPDGRTDESLGAVSLAGLESEALANALMTAETKAKRRVALSICGLGLLDETEVETIPGAATPGTLTTPRPRRVGPGTIFRAWDGQGHASRQPLYDYAQATYGQRITTLPPDALQALLTWVSTQTPSAAEASSDAA